VGHLGYVLVFFNGCESLYNSEAWQNALGGTKGRPWYLGWTADTPGLAGLAGEGFAEGVIAYFREMESENPPTKDIGPYVYDKIIEYCKRKLPYDPEGILRSQLKLIHK
jgi:hypothetical protein